MRTDAMAQAYFNQALSRLKTARSAFRDRDYPFTVRQSQECVELSLKAALRLCGIEHPKEHDLKDLLLEVRGRFPDWFSARVGEFGDISARLAKERGPSMYGDEEKGIPPSELFKKADAAGALKDAETVHAQCRRLLKEFIKKAKRPRR